MASEGSFVAAPDLFYRPARGKVTFIGFQFYPLGAEGVKSKPEQQEFTLAVQSCSLKCGTYPGSADLQAAVGFRYA